MARSDAYNTKAQSPVTLYASWSSNEKAFSFYNKEKGENELLKLPLKLVHLDEMATIKGYHDASQSGLYSNEVRSTRNEVLNVRSFKTGEIVSGIYADIKAKVQAAGGKYNQSIYFYHNGNIINISLQGAALQAWSEFTKDARKNRSLLDNYILIESAADMKKGSVKYSIPVFKVGTTIAKEDSKASDASYDTLNAYFAERYKDAKEEQNAQPVAPLHNEKVEQAEEDLLPF